MIIAQYSVCMCVGGVFGCILCFLVFYLIVICFTEFRCNVFFIFVVHGKNVPLQNLSVCKGHYLL